MTFPDKFTLEVTQEDIDKATALRNDRKSKYNCIRHCPVSTAAQRALGNSDLTSAAGNVALIDNIGVVVGYIPETSQVRAFQYDFDNRQNVKPFSAVLTKDEERK